MIDTAELVITARATECPDDLESVVLAIEARKATAEGWLSEVVKPSEAFNNSVETSPMGPVCDPSNTITNLPSNLKDTVIASEESSSVEIAGTD